MFPKNHAHIVSPGSIAAYWSGRVKSVALSSQPRITSRQNFEFRRSCCAASTPSVRRFLIISLSGRACVYLPRRQIRAASSVERQIFSTPVRCAEYPRRLVDPYCRNVREGTHSRTRQLLRTSQIQNKIQVFFAPYKKARRKAERNINSNKGRRRREIRARVSRHDITVGEGARNTRSPQQDYTIMLIPREVVVRSSPHPVERQPNKTLMTRLPDEEAVCPVLINKAKSGRGVGARGWREHHM